MAFLAPVAGFLVEAAFAVGMPISIGTALVGSAAILGLGAKAVYDYVIDGMMDDLNVDTMTNRTVTTKDPITPRRLVYGTIRTGGQIVYQANSGNNNKYLHTFVVFSVGRISRIHEIYFNNELAMRLDTSNNVRYYGRYSTNSDGSPSVDGRDVFITMKAGTDTQSAITGLTNMPPDWTSSHKLSGLAYAYVQLTFNETTHVNGFPNITAVVRGKKHYNPKYDDTVDGGSGDQRIDDEDTWEYSNNPTVCLLNYMLDDHIGLGESIDNFHMPTILDSIDTCEATFDDTEVITTNELFTVGERYKIVTTGTSIDWASIGVSGTPQEGQIFTALDDGASLFGNELYMGSARKVYNTYACDGIIDSRNSHKSNIQNILSSMNGQLVYSNGKFRILAYDTKDPTLLTLTEKDILGNFDVITKQSRRNMYNRVRGKYMSSENNYSMTEYPVQKFVDSTTNEATFEIDDGEVIYYEQTLPMTTRHANAQRLARLTLLRSRMQNTIKFTGTARCLLYTVGDRINVSNETLGYSADDPKIYQVSNLSARIDTKNGLVVDIEAKEDAPSIYDWQMSDAEDFTTGSVLDLWDGKLDPPTFINAINAYNGVGMYVGWLHPEYRDSVEFELTVSPVDPNFDDTRTYRTSGNTITVPMDEGVAQYKRYNYSVRAVDVATGAVSDSISITTRKMLIETAGSEIIITGTSANPTDDFLREELVELGYANVKVVSNITYLQVDDNGTIINSLPLVYRDLTMFEVNNTVDRRHRRISHLNPSPHDALNGLGAMDTAEKRAQYIFKGDENKIFFNSENKLELLNAGLDDQVYFKTSLDTPLTVGRAYALDFDVEQEESQSIRINPYHSQNGLIRSAGGTTMNTINSYIEIGERAEELQFYFRIRGYDDATNCVLSNFKVQEITSSMTDRRNVAHASVDADVTTSHTITSVDIPNRDPQYDDVITMTHYGEPRYFYRYYDSQNNYIAILTITDRVEVYGKSYDYYTDVSLTRHYYDDGTFNHTPGVFSANVVIRKEYELSNDIDGEAVTMTIDEEFPLDLSVELKG